MHNPEKIHLPAAKVSADEELRKTNRILQTLSTCNEILVRATEERTFLENICDAIVAVGGYRTAWIGYAVEDREQTIMPVARAGETPDYLLRSRLSWADSELGCSPAGNAIRTWEASFRSDAQTGSDLSSTRDEAVKGGHPGVVAFPLIVNRQCLGAVTIHAPEELAFEAKDILFFGELTANLAYGIETLRSRAELKESEGMLRAIFEAATDGILLTDARSRKLLTGNRAICVMLGYSMGELLQLGIEDIHPPDSHPYVFEQFERQKRREIDLAVDMPVKKKDGTVFYADIAAAPVIFDDKAYMTGIYRDVTQRRQTEERLRQAQRMEAIGTLAGGIAHDFNNILGVILGNAELCLLDPPASDEYCECLQAIRAAGNRARDLVRQILTVSRQSSRKKATVSVVPIVKEVIKMLRATIPSTIDIRTDIRTLSGTVFADPTEIHQILMNLGANAAHAMREGGGVMHILLDEASLDDTRPPTLTDLAPGDYLWLQVRDSGHGIDPSFMDRIFEPYFTTKKAGEGTGLGLAVTHGIVSSCGGAITVASEPGRGSCFDVYLPGVSSGRDDEPGSSQEPIPGGHEHVLVVDDEPLLLHSVTRTLERLGYSVTGAANASEALAAFRKAPLRFDLVITDQTMPGMTGLELAGELRLMRPGIPVILTTGFSHQVTPEKIEALGIEALLMKPASGRELALSVRAVLDKGASEKS